MNDLRPIIESELLPFVARPVRYIGNELNTVRKDLSRIGLHGVLCFPEVYDIGMSHYGLQVLYHIVNREPSWALSRCFHPWTDAEKIMREKNIPLYCLEYATPVSAADWLGFSMQYELHYANLVNMLDLAGIPVWSRDRDGKWPLVVAGGPCTINPEPFAGFVDAVLTGDGEEACVEMCRVMERAKRDGAGRAETLERLSRIAGVYVPAFYPVRRQGLFLVPDMTGRQPVHAAKVPRLRPEDGPSKPLVPLIDVVHHRLAVEVMRGCTRGCRFCSAGTYYRPVRERDAGDVFCQIETGATATGWRDVGLLSLSTADYSGLDDLLVKAAALARNGHIDVSLPSTRIDALTDRQMELLQAVSRTSSMTIAPEAGSERLRRVINKGFSDARVYETVERLLATGVQTIKLYFMIGLPAETPQDVSAIVEMVRRIAGRAWATSKRRVINVAVSPFSPKAQTAFQWEAMDTVEELERKARQIKQALRVCRNVKVSYRDAAVTCVESLLARGDRKTGQMVFRAWQLGARLDGWEECFSFDTWVAAARDCGIDMRRFTGAIPDTQPLPWSAVQSGVSEAFLRAERGRAHAGEETGDCRAGECAGCGVCGPVGPVLAAKPGAQERPQQAAASPVETGRRPRPATPSTCGLYRATYRKTGGTRFLGHRDMVSIFLRAFTAVEVPVEYSNGFHPHPRVSFGPPLPLGVAGERELFDLPVTGDFRPDAEKINRWLPDGLCVTGMEKKSGRPPAITADMTAARYEFRPIGNAADAAVREAIGRLLSRGECEVVYERNGETVVKQVRPLILGMTALGDDGAFEALLQAQPGRTCTPFECWRALGIARPFTGFLVTRMAALCKDGSGRLIPLD